jgi:hypothetical protein
MSMPITYKIYSCKSCDYTKSFSSRDPFPRPKHNLLKACIDRRYCNCCNELTQCFVSKGGEYHLGDLKNGCFLFLFRSEDYILKNIKRIEEKRRSLLYLFNDIFGKESARLASLYKDLERIRESKNKCKKLTKKAAQFYDKLPDIIRCLKCSGDDVSEKEDRCKCGGSFKVTVRQSTFRINFGSRDYYEYDKNGYSNLVTEKF